MEADKGIQPNLPKKMRKGEAIAAAKKGDKGIQPKKIWKGTTTKRPLQVTRGH